MAQDLTLKRRLSQAQKELAIKIQRLEAYPAVFLPRPEGGFDVVFPNFPKLMAFGPTRKQAVAAAVEALSVELGITLRQGFPPPMPSRPENLIPDEDEPPGTFMLMLEPDRQAIAVQLGLAPTRPASKGPIFAKPKS